jgi:hypothetical protein
MKVGYLRQFKLHFYKVYNFPVGRFMTLRNLKYINLLSGQYSYFCSLSIILWPVSFDFGTLKPILDCSNTETRQVHDINSEGKLFNNLLTAI